jgi:hypothetical protein
MSSRDIHEYEQGEILVTPNIDAQVGNSMKLSQLSNIPDPNAGSYASYNTDFNASTLNNSDTDKSEDYWALPWCLYAPSGTGFAGTEQGIAWRDTPIAMIKNQSEVGQGSAACTFYQENNVFAQRSITLVGQFTASALQSTGEEIALNIDDAPAPATTASYAVNGNSALVDRFQFFQSTSTFSSGSPSTNAIQGGSNGYWSGVSYVRAKFLSDFRWKAGVKRYGFIQHFDFNGLNGTNFPLKVK